MDLSPTYKSLEENRGKLGGTPYSLLLQTAPVELSLGDSSRSVNISIQAEIGSFKQPVLSLVNTCPTEGVFLDPGAYEVEVPGDPGSGGPRENCEQPLGPPPPGVELPTGKPLRRLLWALAEGLVRRGCSEPRVCACCRVRWQPEVAVMVRVKPSEVEGVAGARCASYRGLVTCTSVWACPLCMWKIKVARAEELKKLVAYHGPDRVEMLTLTVRHSARDSVKELRQGLTKSMELFQQGKDWAALRRRYGLVGLARAFEITHGQHGWHPHHHVLVFLEKPLSDEERKALRDVLSDRWRRVVLKSGLGEPHEPDDEHGCCLTPVRQSDYLSKLGLEMVDLFTKRGRGKGSRTPLQIAHDILVHDGRPADVALWREYAAGMKGARFLNYSKEVQEMRKVLGLRATDEELAAQEDGPAEVEPELVATISAPRWWAVCRTRGARERILSEAERAGGEAVELEVDVCVAAVEEWSLEQAARCEQASAGAREAPA